LVALEQVYFGELWEREEMLSALEASMLAMLAVIGT
jgi:hypothetical protein